MSTTSGAPCCASAPSDGPRMRAWCAGPGCPDGPRAAATSRGTAPTNGGGVMATRLTADAVQIVSTGDHVMALVTGRNGRVYVVDRNAAWSPAWLCTCGHASDPGACAHIRETKVAIR